MPNVHEEAPERHVADGDLRSPSVEALHLDA